jgi:hypothetical protein
MLSITRFERINGHVPKVAFDRRSGIYQATCQCDCRGYAVMVYGDPARSESRALESLRDQVLREHGQIAMERQGWQCAECGRVAPLSAHHKEYRSHGRDDRVENLRGLDSNCHGKEHRR